jgi:hypothetical protein
VITVLDPRAARTALVAGQLACPQPGCGGLLRAWSKARARSVRGLEGISVRLRPDRAKCRDCRRSHVLLPGGYLPRRGYDVHVIGAALLQAAEGGGYRRVAATVGVPEGTVRGWLSSVRAGSGELVAGAVEVFRAAGLDLYPQRALVWAGRPLPEVVSALGTVARGFVLALARPYPAPLRPVRAGGTGIDYVRIIAERHRRAICARLGVIDPSGLLPGLRGWALISVLTRRRLLTSSPDG